MEEYQKVTPLLMQQKMDQYLNSAAKKCRKYLAQTPQAIKFEVLIHANLTYLKMVEQRNSTGQANFKSIQVLRYVEGDILALLARHCFTAKLQVKTMEMLHRAGPNFFI